MRGRPVVSDVVTRDVNATYLGEDGARVPLPTTLRFDPLDPVAITLSMRLSDQRQVVWTFARQLLADGADQATGLGDVRIEPVCQGRRKLLSVELSSPTGHATVELPATWVCDFVRRTYDLVPASEEGTVIDLDLELSLELGVDPG